MGSSYGNIHWVAITALQVILSSSVAGAQDEETPQPTGMYALTLPPPIDRAEIDRYAAILRLAEPQRAFVEFLLENAYRPQRAKAESELIPDLVQASREAVSVVVPLRTSARAVELYDAFVEHEQRVKGALDAVDRVMLEDIRRILAEPQLVSFPRVLAWRSRATCSLIDREIPAARIDLARLMQEMQIKSEPLAEIDQLMAEYEAAITPAFVGLEEEVMRRRVTLQYIELERQFGTNGERVPPNSREAVKRNELAQQRQEQMLSEGGRLERRIAQLNNLFLPRILEEIPREQAEQLRKEYRRRAYPRVYPDTEDPFDIYDRLMLDDRIKPGLRGAIQATWEVYRQSYKQLCASMERESYRWYEHISATQHYEGAGGYTGHKREMRRLHDRRLALNRQFVSQVRSLVADTGPHESLEHMRVYLEE